MGWEEREMQRIISRFFPEKWKGRIAMYCDVKDYGKSRFGRDEIRRWFWPWWIWDAYQTSKWRCQVGRCICTSGVWGRGLSWRYKYSSYQCVDGISTFLSSKINWRVSLIKRKDTGTESWVTLVIGIEDSNKPGKWGWNRRTTRRQWLSERQVKKAFSRKWGDQLCQIPLSRPSKKEAENGSQI